MNNIVNEYNNTPHRGIGGRKPSSIKTKAAEKTLLHTVYNHIKLFNEGKFKIGDFVRIADHRGVFDKGYEPNFSTAIFKITKINNTYPITYKVADKESEIELKRSYYEQELKKVMYPNAYLVKKILKRKGNKVFVSWLGYSDKYNSWINYDDIV